jgi:preprotein translocase subunit SecE
MAEEKKDGMSAADIALLALAVLLVAAGIAGYYWLQELPLVVRVLSVLGGIVAGLAAGYFSTPGREFAVFSGEAVTEVKKVVWPTRKETMQTTAAVFAFVVVMALLLWLTDKSLEWALYELILKRT